MFYLLKMVDLSMAINHQRVNKPGAMGPLGIFCQCLKMLPPIVFDIQKLLKMTINSGAHPPFLRPKNFAKSTVIQPSCKTLSVFEASSSPSSTNVEMKWTKV